jgi:hypothetical protein
MGRIAKLITVGLKKVTKHNKLNDFVVYCVGQATCRTVG